MTSLILFLIVPFQYAAASSARTNFAEYCSSNQSDNLFDEGEGNQNAPLAVAPSVSRFISYSNCHGEESEETLPVLYSVLSSPDIEPLVAFLADQGWTCHITDNQIGFAPEIVAQTYWYSKEIWIEAQSSYNENILRYIALHEIGHALDFAFGNPSRLIPFISELSQVQEDALPFHTSFNSFNPQEKFADVFYVYVSVPKYMQNTLPDLYALYEDLFKNNGYPAHPL